MNTLCGKKVLQHKDSDDPSIAHVEEGVKIKPITVGAFVPYPTDVYRSLNYLQSSSLTRRAPVSP